MSLFGTLSDAFTAAAGLAGAAGSISAGREAKKAAEANARAAEKRAVEERRVTKEDIQDATRRLSAIAARNRTARAASGITRTGSVLLTDKAFRDETALQIAKIQRGGESTVAALEAQAQQQRRAGKAAQRRGFFGAGTTLLTAGAEIFG